MPFFLFFAHPFLSQSDMVIIKTWFWFLFFFVLECKNTCQRLTLQQGCRCRHRLRNAVHAVDGLEEFWDTIILIGDRHLHL